MADHSFSLKGWAVALSTALFAAILALTKHTPSHADFSIVYVPIAMFWLVDAYYLSPERLYRRLYDHVRQQPGDETDFAMDTQILGTPGPVWLRAILSRTTWMFYVALLVAITVIRNLVS